MRRTDYTNAERQERHRQRMERAGLKRIEVKVPPEREAEIRAIAAQMRAEAELVSA
jgi:hypothetical protein